MREGHKAPSIAYYDYIIIGGGTVGCPLATTLSRTSKVLVLERGGSPYTKENTVSASEYAENLSELSSTSPIQDFTSEDGISNARARILGGGSSINRGFYSRASRDYVVRAGLDESLVKRSYKWIEKLLVHKPSPLLQWQSAVRDGLLEASVTPYNGFTYDHIIGTKIGGTIIDRRGQRHSTADLLVLAKPERITVSLHSTAHKILFNHKGGQRPKAYGVIFMDSTRAMHTAYLNEGLQNEIIISAGAIGSPQLLMLSGVGPKAHLQSLGIKVVMEQPLVGQSMSDNPRTQILVPSHLPVEDAGGAIVGITKGSKSYIFTDSGNNTFPNSSLRGGDISAKVAYPLSTGNLKLVDRNPNRNPSVRFNYFSRYEDVLACVEHLKIIKRVIQSKALSSFRYHNMSFESLLNLSAEFLGYEKLRRQRNYSSSKLGQYCKDSVATNWHYHGGCHVGQVVDHEYRVIGADALRVLDFSTFNVSPGTNPQATLMMFGRYMGVKILQERKLGMKKLGGTKY